MPTNTYGDISPRTAAYAAARLLKRGQHLMVAERFGQPKPLPRNHGKTMKFRRYESLPRADAPLAEGIPPAGSKLTYTDVSVTLEQYGDFVPHTDVIKDTHEDPILRESLDLCSEQIAETKEVIRIAVLKAGTNVFYANSAANRAAVNSPPLRSDLRRIYRSFRRNKAQEISRIVAASTKISTQPVEPAFFILGSTDLDGDFRNMDGFVKAAEYSNSAKALPGEIGSVEQFRIILTPLFEPWLAGGASGTTYLSNGDAPSSSSACDVYPLIIVGKDAYGLVPLQGENAVTPFVVNPKPSHSNKLGQEGHVGWKMYDATVILQQYFMARLECAATAVP